MPVQENELNIQDLAELKPKGPERRLVGAELTRLCITLSLLLLLLIIVVWALAKVNSDNWANMKELLEIIIPVLTTLLGSSIGFYFGKSSSR